MFSIEKFINYKNIQLLQKFFTEYCDNCKNFIDKFDNCKNFLLRNALIIKNVFEKFNCNRNFVENHMNYKDFV